MDNTKIVEIKTSIKLKTKKIVKNLSTTKSLINEKTSLDLINYLNLINDSYPPRIFKNFLKLIIITPHIILEETENSDFFQKQKKRSFSNNKMISKIINVKNFKSKKTNFLEKNKNLINLKKDMFEKKIENLKFQKKEKFPQKFKTQKKIDIDFDCLKTRSSTLEDFTENLSKKEIENLIKKKMSKLEKYNKSLESKKTAELVKKYNLKNKNILKIVKIQKKFKSCIIKKKFFQAIFMNKLLIHQKNLILLKKSLKNYDKFVRNSNSNILRVRSKGYFKF